MKEKEIWMQKLKEKLDDYSEPTPASGWERLEKELLPPAEKRIIPYRRRWMAVAAAALLAAVSSVSLYFLDSPVADEIRHTSVSRLATTPDEVMPVQQEPLLQEVAVRTVSSRAASATNRLIAKNDRSAAMPNEEVATRQRVQEKKIGETENSAEASSDVVNEVHENVNRTESGEQPKRREVRRPSGKNKLHLPEPTSAAKGGRWSIGASVGNAGTLSGGGNSENISMSRMQMDMASSSNGVIKVPEGQTVVFKEGVPYLQDLTKITDISHHQPVSFGLSVRKDLKKGFSIETGITYTLLSSGVKLGGSDRAEDQKLHYVGIPVRANWNFVKKKLVTLYVSAGGAVEKCVYGELAGEKQTVKPLQLSLTGAVGAQVNATDRLGFYIEPGVSYFFDDGSSAQTIRKEAPCNFNLQAGVRFTY